MNLITQYGTARISISIRVRVWVGFILQNLVPPGGPLYVPTAGQPGPCLHILLCARVLDVTESYATHCT